MMGKTIPHSSLAHISPQTVPLKASYCLPCRLEDLKRLPDSCSARSELYSSSSTIRLHWLLLRRYCSRLIHTILHHHAPFSSTHIMRSNSSGLCSSKAWHFVRHGPPDLDGNSRERVTVVLKIRQHEIWKPSFLPIVVTIRPPASFHVIPQQYPINGSLWVQFSTSHLLQNNNAIRLSQSSFKFKLYAIVLTLILFSTKQTIMSSIMDNVIDILTEV